MISNENFPDKVYGDYLFPQGHYEAFRIIIGNGVVSEIKCGDSFFIPANLEEYKIQGNRSVIKSYVVI